MAAPIAAVAPANEQGYCVPVAYEFDDLDEWLLENLRIDDPVDTRRRDLIGWLIAADCTILDVRYSDEIEQWELRFTCAGDVVATPAQVEALLRRVARGCRCEIEQLVAIVTENHVSSRFRLRPSPMAQ
jgi:hypothetical protein